MSKPKGKVSAVEEPPAEKFDPKSVVRIQSKDGHEFIIDRHCARVSKLIKSAMEGGKPEGVRIDEQTPDVIILEEVPAPVLEKAIQYFYYKNKYDSETEVDKRLPFVLTGNVTQVELLLAVTILQA